MRIAALRAIARVPAAAVNQLSRVFRDPGRLVRNEAVRLLRSIGVVEDNERLAAKLDAAAAIRRGIVQRSNDIGHFSELRQKTSRILVASTSPTCRSRLGSCC